MIAAIALMLANAASASPVLQVERLSCGSADLRMSSGVLTGKAAPLTPVAQTLTRKVGKAYRHVALERSSSVTIDGQRVLGRYVSSWACITGHGQQRYVLLGYACAVDPGNPGDCGGQKEWFRVLGTNGRFADTGVPHDGPIRERLDMRLGISDAMAAGVTMTPVVR